MISKTVSRGTCSYARQSLAGLAIVFIVTACASMPAIDNNDGTQWTNLQDCFMRDVVVLPSNAEFIAKICGGPEVAGNSSLTGKQRSSATYNAAMANYQLAQNSLSGGNLSIGASRLEDAHLMIESSYLHEMDQVTNEPTKEFYLNREWLTARIALTASELAPSQAVYCGPKEQCLRASISRYETLELSAPFLTALDAQTGKKQAAPLLCKILDDRSAVYQKIGDRYLYLSQDDLNQMVLLCPDYTEIAKERLAEIAFSQADQSRVDLVVLSEPHLNRDRNRREALGAITNYEKAAIAPRYKLSAERGIGEVSLWLSGWDREFEAENIKRAAEAFERAAKQAAVQQDSIAEAEMRTLQGHAVFTLAHSMTSDPSSKSDLYHEALKAFEAAVEIDATPMRRLQLARAQSAVGELIAAKKNYRIGISALSGADRAAAQLELASVHAALDEMTEERQLLDSVYSQTQAQPGLQFSVGKRLYEIGELQIARQALLRASENLPANDRAEANYILSVTDLILRPTGWKTTSVTRAERAIQLANGDARYSRQACLTHILRAGEPLKKGSDAPWCERRGSAAENLLAGMYLLKRAQSMEVSAYDVTSQSRWRAMLRLAEDIFKEGLTRAESAEQTPILVRFDDLQRDVNIDAQLSNGLLVISRCRRDIALEPGDEEWINLDAFFGHYGVLKCS